MRSLIVLFALFVGVAVPAHAQGYFDTIATFRHGNGYAPATVVAGWEKDASFTVIAIAPDGDWVSGAAVASDWKATVVVGPREAAEEDTTEDDRYLDKQATMPKRQTRPAGPPVQRRETVYASLTCPALVERIAALKPLTTFAFNPPSLAGNEDGPRGDGREGLDLWIRIGDGEINKEAGTSDSELGRWFEETSRELAACPAKSHRP